MAGRKRFGGKCWFSGTVLAVSAVLCPPSFAEPANAAGNQGAEILRQQFLDPPANTRPRVWWHWMNGNISKDGIAKDLAWMKRIGLGGVQNFDANLRTPQIVERRLTYMTPEWKEAFGFAVAEADRLGLEFAIAASPGWSETGGPWVVPADGMKKLVWSETEVGGGTPLAVPLAAPPSVTGQFQSLVKPASSILGGAAPAATHAFYRDVAVLAFPIAAAVPPEPARWTDGKNDVPGAAALADADLATVVELPQPEQGPATLQVAFAKARTIRSARLFVAGGGSTFGGSAMAVRLEASGDGRRWRKVADIATDAVPTTAAFRPFTASHFRLLLERKSGGGLQLSPLPGVDVSPLAALFGGNGATRPFRIGEFHLFAEDRIDRAETKAGFSISRDYDHLPSAAAETPGVQPERVLDLTARLRPDGNLDWVPPKGRWRILRFGYSLLGTTNGPASPEATGLEVDKFDGAAVRRYLEHYLGMYRQTVGPQLFGGAGIRALLTDSIEVGAANWTPALIAQFKARRGYDPTPWLPALTGTIVGSRSSSDRFLYDFRRTLADLIAAEHYGTVAEVAHENGLKVYGEALEDGRPSLGDDMAMRSHADVPMAALWAYRPEKGPRATYLADMKGAASVAHIYGRNQVAAESLTAAFAPWAFAPADLKPVIDLAFATGINLPIIHTSVHVPTDDKQPGLSLFINGQYFNRNDTWAGMARPWIDYIARNSVMLQNGRNVADIAYFYGEDGPLTGLYGEAPVADAPTTNAFDFVNADALLNAFRVEAGALVTPGGARYRAIYLGGSSQRMTLPVLRKLATLVKAGAVLIGRPPRADPSLADDARVFEALVKTLWPRPDGGSVGRGRVLVSDGIGSALAAANIAPDFRFDGGSADSDIRFVHRAWDGGDSYFLSNRKDRTEVVEAHFRVTGRAPELWRAETGVAEPASFRLENGETVVSLTLAPGESVHVVFTKPATDTVRTVGRTEWVEQGALDGPWRVAFQPGRGAPAGATLATLVPLNESADAGIRYFSGIAEYDRAFVPPSAWRRGTPLWLDLGAVRDVAEVWVNGQLAGTAWHAPYRVDITRLIHPGSNDLQIKVANLWVNRLIGDAQPGAAKITWTALPTYLPDAPLRPSGLIGPVRLLGPRPVP